MKVEFFNLFPVNELLEAKDNHKVYMNRYWIVYDGNILQYKSTKAWQCNANEELIRSVFENNPIYEGCEVVFYNFLYIPQ